MAQLDDYVEYLSTEVGPRPAGTEEEQQAALYISDKLKTDAGLQVSIEEFASASNVFNVKAICSIVAFVSVLFFVIIPAASILWIVLGLAAAVIYVLESLDNPIITRALARGASQNIVAKYKPQTSDSASRSRKIIVMANYDTGRSVPGIVRSIEGTGLPLAWICLGGVVAVPVLEFVRLVASAAAPVLNALLIIAAIVAVLPFVREILVRVSPLSEGANCNASGTAALMEAARCVGTGSLTSDEFADAERDYVVHDEATALENGVVPAGAEIVYEVQEESEEPEDRPQKSEGERLATAKAAIAAFTGQPGATWSDDEIEENLQGTEYSPTKKKTVVVRKVVSAPSAPETDVAAAPEEPADEVRVVDLTTNEDVADVDAAPAAGQEQPYVQEEVVTDTREGVNAAVASGGEVSVSDDGAQGAVEQAPVESASQASAQASSRKNAAVEAAQRTAVPSKEASTVPARPAQPVDSSVPSWYLEAQKKARRPKQESKPVQRSRFASALEAAESRGSNVFHDEARKAYEERLAAQMREDRAAMVQAQEQERQRAQQPRTSDQGVGDDASSVRAVEQENQATPAMTPVQADGSPATPNASVSDGYVASNDSGTAVQETVPAASQSAAAPAEPVQNDAPNPPFVQFTAPVLQKENPAQNVSPASEAREAQAGAVQSDQVVQAATHESAVVSSSAETYAAQTQAGARQPQYQQPGSQTASYQALEAGVSGRQSRGMEHPDGAQANNRRSGLSLGDEFNDNAASPTASSDMDGRAMRGSSYQASNAEGGRQAAAFSDAAGSNRVEIEHPSSDYLAGEYDEMPPTASFQEFEQAFAEKDVAVPSFMDPWKTQERAQQEASETAHSANRYEVDPNGRANERVAIEVEFRDDVSTPAQQAGSGQVIDEQPVSAESEAADEFAAENQARNANESAPSSDQAEQDDPYAVPAFDAGTTPLTGNATRPSRQGAASPTSSRSAQALQGSSPSDIASSQPGYAEGSTESEQAFGADAVSRESQDAFAEDAVEDASRSASDASRSSFGQQTADAASGEREASHASHQRRSIALPHVGMTGRLPFASHSKQRAPLADAGDKGGKSAAKGLLSTLPSIDMDDAGATKNPSRSGMLRGLKSHLPSTATDDQVAEDEGASGAQTAVSSVGSFGAAGATGAFAPVGDELLEDVSPDEIYVDDADDSDMDENYTETGAFAGPGYVDMPKSHFRNFFNRFRRKTNDDEDEQSPQQWLDVDEEFDPREEGRKRGGWESFNEESDSSSAEYLDEEQGFAADEGGVQTAAPANRQTGSASAAADAASGRVNAAVSKNPDRANDAVPKSAGSSMQDAKNQSGDNGMTYDYATGTAYGADAYGSASYVSGVYSDEVYGEEHVSEAGDFGSARPDVKPGDTSPFLPAIQQHGNKRHHRRNNHKGASWQGGGFSTDRVSEDGQAIDDAVDAAAVDDEVERIYQFKEDLFGTEVWFVALGSEQDYHDGVRQFAAMHSEDLRGAVVIDLEALGRGKLSLPQQEGSLRQKKISSRMKRFVKRASSETGVPIATKDTLRDESAASILSRQEVQAMHLVGLDGNRVAAKGDAADMYENLDMNKLQDNVGLILSLLKQI